jgi:two-component system sensor histidine kinase AlgZ
LTPTDSGSEPRSSLRLPDLCAPQAVLVLVIVGELLAVSLELYDGSVRAFDWGAFGRSSLFIQWLALSSAALLCRLRGWLARQPIPLSVAVSYGLVLGLCVLFSTVVMLMADELGALGVATGLDQVLRNLLICAVVAGVALRYFYLQGELQRRQQAELASRVAALQARIRPHFLFNSLNSIAGLIPEDPDAAERAVEDLAGLFRASLRDPSAEIELGAELDLCRQYLAIESHRLGDRLTVDWQLEDLPLRETVPPLLLQPLVENAVYHGIQLRPEGGAVTIRLRCEGDDVIATVTNPLAPTGAVAAQGNQMALQNIRERLRAWAGDRARLDTERRADCFVATLRLPLGS